MSRFTWPVMVAIVALLGSCAPASADVIERQPAKRAAPKVHHVYPRVTLWLLLVQRDHRAAGATAYDDPVQCMKDMRLANQNMRGNGNMARCLPIRSLRIS